MMLFLISSLVLRYVSSHSVEIISNVLAMASDSERAWERLSESLHKCIPLALWDDSLCLVVFFKLFVLHLNCAIL